MLPILFEDNYLLAIDKSAGLQTERDRFGNPSAEAQVADYLQKTYPWKKQLITGVAHRLDRPVSGVLLFAKTPMALKSLGAQFAAREARKFYRALTEGQWRENTGELTHWLRKDAEARRAVVTHNRDTSAQECRLRYEVLEQIGSYSLVEVELLTGRYHQIRAQLSAVSCPIAGDEKYGGRTLEGSGICLHAHRLRVLHPKNGDEIWLEAPMPGWNFL